MGKVALITGASSGLGAGIAKELAGKGIHCVLVARRKDKLEEVKKEILANGGMASVYPCDTTNKTQVKKMSCEVVAAIGVPDILVNNAGVAVSGAVVDADYDSWDKMIDVNIRSHLYILGEFLPGMKERGTGHVVNITSAAEMDPAPMLSVYCGTKHFWTGFSAALRQELVGTDVKVTNVQPGMINTDMIHGIFDGIGGNLVATTKQHKMLAVEDVAGVVWESVSRPSRCYQTTIRVDDSLAKDPEFLVAAMTSMVGAMQK